MALLDDWSKQGGVGASAFMYQEIKGAIESDPVLGAHQIEIYLQGSYANSTNIRVDSDIDVVVQSSEAFFFDYHENMTQWDRSIVNSMFPSATYPYGEFRHDVLQALSRKFSNLVHDGNKAIQVTVPNKVKVDVVPAFDYRLYTAPRIASREWHSWQRMVSDL